MKFVNCSNHPSVGWMSEQREAAEAYGQIVDIPFPQVNAMAQGYELDQIVDKMFNEIMQCQPAAVMCMGEFVVCYRLVTRLKEQGIKVLAASSERESREFVDQNGKLKKEAYFVFRGFREF